MKQLVFTLIAFFTIQTVSAQKIKWEFTAKKLSGDKYELHMTATVPSGWHVYSQNSPEDGPIPTKFTYNANALVKLDGKTKEVGTLEKYYDQNFKVEVKYYGGKVDFVQVVKLKSKIKTNISGQVESMICNDSRCLPTTAVNFSIALK